MFAICIESSHQKGMGHLFRSLNFIRFLNRRNEKCIVCINNDKTAMSILEKNNISFQIVNYENYESDWESILIREYKIKFWINDRLNTNTKHSFNVKKNNIKLITFDDHGSGAELADINIAALTFNNKEKLKGSRILTGLDYLILNKEIEKYQRIRTRSEKIIVTLGGSDTYGVTLKVVDALKQKGKSATIITGPSFLYEQELKKIVNPNFIVKKNVKSLIKEFYNYDIAITGGGITPFEANASGLPCIIIANEKFEVKNGKYLHDLGTSVFAGYHININFDIFYKDLDIEKMSRKGIDNIKLNAVENVYSEIRAIS